MFDRRDYLMRMIEQMGVVLSRIRQIILGGGDASGDLLRVAGQTGVDVRLLRALDADSLMGLLAVDGTPDPSRTWLTAELLYLDGLCEESAGRTEDGLALYHKALRLFLALDPSVIGGIPEAAGRVAEIEARIDALTSAGPPSAA